MQECDRDGDPLWSSRMSAPAVTIVVPNYDYAAYLPRRIDSLLAQTFQDFEIVFLDDASTDDSVAVITSRLDPARMRLEVRQTNSGNPFVQWNRGAALARGRYLWFAEADDWADPHLLERLVAVLDAHPNVGLVHCPFFRVDPTGRVEDLSPIWWRDLDPTRWTRDYVAPGREEVEWLARWNVISNASGVVLRHAVFEQVGGADETLPLAADWKLWVKMALASDVGFVATPLNYWRWHDRTQRARTERAGRVDAQNRAVLHFIAQAIGRAPDRVEAQHHLAHLESALRWRDTVRARRHARTLLQIAPGVPRHWLLALRAAVGR